MTSVPIEVILGGTLGGTIASNFSTAIMEIDYVRVYEQHTQSVSKIHSHPRLKVYPNPTQNRIAVLSEDTMTILSIYAISGQRILHKTPNQNEVYLTLELPS